MDAKGHVTTADISDLEVLECIESTSAFPLTYFAARYPKKVMGNKLHKLLERSLIDTDGSEEFRLTLAGREKLAELRKAVVQCPSS